MPLQYINELLELPELQLHKIVSMDAREVHLEASPVAYKQPCPICHSEQEVKRDGRNATVAAAVRKLELEGQQRVRFIEEKQILRTNVLNRWISRSIPMAELKQRSEMADIPLHHRAYVIVTGSILRSDQVGDSFPPDVRNEIVSEVSEVVSTDASDLLSTYTTRFCRFRRRYRDFVLESRRQLEQGSFV